MGVSLAGALGCEDAPAEDKTAGQDPAEDEVLAEAREGLAPATCVTVRRGLLGDVHDAFLSGDFPTWATGSSSNLWIGKSSAGNENQVVFNFDLSFLPEHAIVTSAVFNVWVGWSSNNTQVRAHVITAAWSEATVSRSSFPLNGYDPAVLGSFMTLVQGYRSIDITALAAAWVKGQKARNGILLEETPVVGHLILGSEAANQSARPYLDLCYVIGPKPHRGGALVAGGTTADSESFHFVGSLGEGPSRNHVSASENLKFVGGLVGATQE